MVQQFKSQQDLPAELLSIVHSHEESTNGAYSCVCEESFKRLWLMSSVSPRKVRG